jgi:hypothetical protein
VSTTTTFTLTASNAQGSASQSITVPVINNAVQPIPSTPPTRATTTPGRRNRAGTRDIGTTTQPMPTWVNERASSTHTDVEFDHESRSSEGEHGHISPTPTTPSPMSNPVPGVNQFPTTSPVNSLGLHSNRQDDGLGRGVNDTKGGKTR